MTKKKETTPPKRIMISQKKVVEEIAARMNLYPEDIATILDCAQDVASDFLMMANDDTSLFVSMFRDLKLTASYWPCHVVVNPKTGEKDFVEESLKFGCNYSPQYLEDRREEYTRKKEILRLWNELQDKESAEASEG